MQHKEKKWTEVEALIKDFVRKDKDLQKKLYDLRISVFSGKKISSVVDENEKIKKELITLYRENEDLRAQLAEYEGESYTCSDEEEEGKQEVQQDNTPILKTEVAHVNEPFFDIGFFKDSLKDASNVGVEGPNLLMSARV